MVLLTLLHWCLVSPALGSDSVTGTTTLNAQEAFDAPCSSVRDSVVTFGIWPAPYGITEASRGTVALTTPFGSFGLIGSAHRGWIDLQPSWSEQWHVTTAYRVGATASVRWMQADGFPSHLEGRLRLHAAADIDSTWAVGIGVDDLFYSSTFDAEPMRALRMGLAYRRTFTVAGDLSLGRATSSYIQLTFLTPISDHILGRVTIRSEPLTVSAAVRLDDVVDIPITIRADHIQHVGLRTMLVVEIP